MTKLTDPRVYPGVMTMTTPERLPSGTVMVTVSLPAQVTAAQFAQRAARTTGGQLVSVLDQDVAGVFVLSDVPGDSDEARALLVTQSLLFLLDPDSRMEVVAGNQPRPVHDAPPADWRPSWERLLARVTGR